MENRGVKLVDSFFRSRPSTPRLDFIPGHMLELVKLARKSLVAGIPSATMVTSLVVFTKAGKVQFLAFGSAPVAWLPDYCLYSRTRVDRLPIIVAQDQDPMSAHGPSFSRCDLRCATRF